MVILSRIVQLTKSYLNLLLPDCSGRHSLTTPINDLAVTNKFGLDPFSLATTKGIISQNSNNLRNVGFFSSAYWDVSLQRVGFNALKAQRKFCLSQNWVFPFGDPRIKGCYTPPRGLSQLRHVLHRLNLPRHPPYTYNTSTSNR